MLVTTRSLCVIPHTVLIFGAQLGRAGAHNQTEEKNPNYMLLCKSVIILMIEQSVINK